MNDEMWKGHATAWRWASVAFAVVAIGGSAIAFCPVWWGNDWSEASVLRWVGGVSGIGLIVWLTALSRCLQRDGREFHAALVLGLMLPLTSHSTAWFGGSVGVYPATFHGMLDQYFWGDPGLAIMVALLLLATIGAIGRRSSSWKHFSTLGPER